MSAVRWRQRRLKDRGIFLIFVDNFSKKIFVYFLKEKGQVTETFLEFKALVKNQTENKILRSDNGREYITKELKNHLKKVGIKHQYTIRYTPEQNGVAERENRSIVKRTKSMLFGAELSKTLGRSGGDHCLSSKQITELQYWRENARRVMVRINAELGPFKNLWLCGIRPLPERIMAKMGSQRAKTCICWLLRGFKGLSTYGSQTKKITRSRDVIFFKNFKYGEIEKPGILER